DMDSACRSLIEDIQYTNRLTVLANGGRFDVASSRGMAATYREAPRCKTFGKYTQHPTLVDRDIVNPAIDIR
ncbi:hypothetical protein, partial [Klebsiella aerogenes]|uniref:hypothetical protein n=1 Tax=Klebsiella aerogenes TaxID=548 RepID=UPI0013D13418